MCALASSKTKLCTITELFVMPAPLMVNVGEFPSAFMIVNALAPGLNTMPLSSALNAMKGRVLLEDANVAVSAGPFGTVVGVQLVAVNQSPVAGLAFHVALPAKLLLIVESRSVRMRAAEGRKARARERRGDSILLRWNDFHNTSDCMIFIVITSSCANESCRSRFLCGIVGLNWINGFMGWILSFLPGLREWRARKKILRRHRRDSGLTVSIKLGWSRTGYAIFIILRIGEPEDYVVQLRTDPGDVVKCERLIDDGIHADRPSAIRIRG